MSHLLPIVNPNVYLNYMEPDLAYQYEVSRNICLVVLGAILWDMLKSLPDEIQLFQRPSITVFAYFATRVLSVTYIVLDTLIRVHPINNCSALGHVIATIGLLSVGSTYFLFLRRVHAVYWNSKTVRHIFTALWISCVGSTVLIPLSIVRGSIANTGYCITTEGKIYAIAASVVYVVFELSSYLAISLRLYNTVDISTNKLPWCTILSGRGLPIVSKVFFRNGQQYYLAVTATHFLAFISAVIPSIPFLYKETFSTISILVVTTMACRAFRKLRQVSWHEARLQETFSTLRFSDATPPAL
ncbi:hypothetical protein BDQ17DRAFT_1313982 [Cyathus striatus]|nr:hypothetical protein BDQ17DRAFT_1313982 [Cyathus striatus]